MPTPPYAQVLVSIAGAGLASGGLTVLASQSVAFQMASTVGVTQALWEIFDYPAGWTGPGVGGWALGPDGITYQCTQVTPPTFNLPTIAFWGKFMARLRIQGNPLRTAPDGSLNPGYIAVYTDESTALSMASPSGLKDLAYLEGAQFSSGKQWLGDHKANLRAIGTTQVGVASGAGYAPTLDGSGGVVPGNLVGSAASGSLVKKLTSRGYSLGPSTTTAAAGGAPNLQVSGLVPQQVTGLAGGNPGPVIRDPVSGNMVRVAEPQPDDDYRGEADAIGNLIPLPARIVKPAIRINAKDFGAKGDGATDNLAAFNAAKARATSIGAMLGSPKALVAIVLDGGNYFLSDTFYLATGDSDAGMCLLGEPRSSTSGAAEHTRITWNRVASGSGSAAGITGSTGVITGLTGVISGWIGQYFVVTNGANVGYYPIKATSGSTQITIDTFGGVLVDQIGANWTVCKPVISILSRDCTVENLTIFCNSGATALCGVQSTQAVVSSLNCTRNTFERLRVSSDGTGGIMYWGATVGDAIGTGAYPNNCDYHTFIDCYFDRCAMGCVNLASTTGQIKATTFWRCGFLGATTYGVRAWSAGFTFYSCTWGTLTYGIACRLANDPIECYSAEVEHVAKMLHPEGSQAVPWPVTFIGGRFGVVDLVAVQTAAFGSSDGIYFDWRWSPLDFVNVVIDGSDVPLKIKVTTPTAVTARCTFSGALCSPNLPWVEDIATHNPQSYTIGRGTVGVSGGGMVDIAPGTTEYGAPVMPTDTIPTIAGVKGLASNGDRMNNFEGSVTVGGTTASVDVALPKPEIFDGYGVRIGVESLYGTPSSGSLRTSVSNRSGYTDLRTGFKLSLDAAPGAGNANRYTWQIIGGRWTPLRIANLRHLWVAHQKVTFSSGVIIATWTDLVSGHVFSPFGTAPTIASWRNGMPAATFVAASSQSMRTPALGPYAQPHTIALVCQDSDNAAVRCVVDGRTLAHVICHQASPNIVAGAGSNQVFAPADLSTPSVVVWDVNGASSEVTANGVSAGVANTGANALDGYVMGVDTSLGGALFWNGVCAALLDTNGMLSVADRVSLRSYWRDLYAF